MTPTELAINDLRAALARMLTTTQGMVTGTRYLNLSQDGARLILAELDLLRMAAGRDKDRWGHVRNKILDTITNTVGRGPGYHDGLRDALTIIINACVNLGDTGETPTMAELLATNKQLQEQFALENKARSELELRDCHTYLTQHGIGSLRQNDEDARIGPATLMQRMEEWRKALFEKSRLAQDKLSLWEEQFHSNDPVFARERAYNNGAAAVCSAILDIDGDRLLEGPAFQIRAKLRDLHRVEGFLRALKKMLYE